MTFLNRLRTAFQTLKGGPRQSQDSTVNGMVEGPVERDTDLLAGKNVLITGAGPNIGKSLAIEMGKRGSQIFFTDLNQSWISDLERQLDTQRISSKGFLLDITKTEDTDILCSFLDKNDLSIDILVHNAKLEIKTNTTIDELNLEEWSKTFETNVLGPMYLTKCIVPRMKKRGGSASIIFLTSVHQYIPMRRPNYCSSKATLGMIVKELALELAKLEIRVNGIAPGWVRVDDQGKPKPHPYTPLYKSSIKPEFIARAAVYLGSEYYSRYTTGTVLTIDAGFSLYNPRMAKDVESRKL